MHRKGHVRSQRDCVLPLAQRLEEVSCACVCLHCFRLISFGPYILQEDETSGEVWDAALGCLLHMCCRDGGVVASAVRGLPPATARGLLHCCRTFGW